MEPELYHYGVIGMRWGQHKARTYASDTNAYIRKQNNKKAKIKYKAGEITKSQYKSALKRNKTLMRKKNLKVINDTAKLTPEKNKKISSIYKKYENQAIKTIPHYKLKKGAKATAKLLLKVGLYSATGSVNVIGAGRYLAKYGAKAATTSAIGLATGIATDKAYGIAEDLAYNEAKTQYGKRKERHK